MSSVMLQILEGRSTDAQTGAFLVALSIKGESINEVIGAVSVMRELSEKVGVEQPSPGRYLWNWRVGSWYL